MDKYVIEKVQLVDDVRSEGVNIRLSLERLNFEIDGKKFDQKT